MQLGLAVAVSLLWLLGTVPAEFAFAAHFREGLPAVGSLKAATEPVHFSAAVAPRGEDTRRGTDDVADDGRLLFKW